MSSSKKPTPNRMRIKVPGVDGLVTIYRHAVLSTTLPIFTRIYGVVQKEIDYQPAWIDRSSGLSLALLDPAVKALEIGEYAKAMDDSGRRIVFLGTRLGPLMVYQLRVDPLSPLAVDCDRKLKGSGYVPINFHYAKGQPEGMEVTRLLGWDGSIVDLIKSDESDLSIRRVSIAWRIEVAYKCFTEGDAFTADHQEKFLASHSGILL